VSATATAPARRRGDRLVPVLLLLAAAHLAWSLFAVVPGYLSIDEGTYHFMVRSLAEGHALEVRNGYEDFATPELVAGILRERPGKLVSNYPEVYTFLALPFYAALGYRGLFLLNALAFLGTVVLTWDFTRRLFDPRVASLAALILGLSTFAWDYSQASWPHATSALLVVAAFWCTVRGLDPKAGLRWPLCAGLLAGSAPGVRLDAAFAWPGILLPPAFARPPRWRHAALAAAGLVPGLALLAWINREKFGVWTPFSYGSRGSGATSGLLAYLPFVLAGAGALVAGWLLSRRRVDRLAWRPAALAAGAAVLALGAVALPPVREVLYRLIDGGLQLVVDLRFRDPSIAEPALGRTASGALVYVGALKKSLLQSCPWLPLTLLPCAAALRTPRRGAVAFLLPIPLAYVGAFSYFAWHGGLSLNLRYLVPVLPFLAVLGALGWREAAEGTPGARAAGTAGALVAAACFALLAPRTWGSPAEQEGPLLDLPLGIAAAMALGAAVLAVPTLRPIVPLRRAVAAAAGAGFAWAALVTFAYDAPRARAHRAANLEVARQIAPWVEEGSLLLVPYPDPFFALIEIDGLRLAVPGRDRFADFRPLVDHHLDRGRPVFAALPLPVWRHLAATGRLEGLRVGPAGPGSPVLRIGPAPPAAAEPEATPTAEGQPPRGSR